MFLVLLLLLCSGLLIALIVTLFQLNVPPEKVEFQPRITYNIPHSRFRTNITFPTTPILLTQQHATEYGKFVFVHDRGFIATAARTTEQQQLHLLFYTITNTSFDKLGTEILLPQFLTTGEPAEIVNGCFLDSLGIAQEIYYLVVVMGYNDADNNLYGREAHIYVYQSGIAGAVWMESSVLIQHPLFGTDANPRPWDTLPWVGCFGNQVQGTLVQNITGGLIHSLFLSGTQFEPLNLQKPQPSSGGMIFHYIFLSNTVTPILQLQYVIQDPMLITLSLDPSSPVPPEQFQSDYYLRGFGSVFYVSGDTIAVSNLTNQSSLALPCGPVSNPVAPNGYVQVLRFIDGIWMQQNIICQEQSVGKRLYSNRIVGDNTTVGFGNGLMIQQNYLFVTSANNKCFIYNLATDGQPNPTTFTPWSSINLTSASTTSFPGPAYNRNIVMIGDSIVISSYSDQPDTDVVSIYQLTPGQVQPFKQFTLLQLLGKGANGGSTSRSLNAFAQFLLTTKTPDGLHTMLVMSNPVSKNIVIYEN